MILLSCEAWSAALAVKLLWVRFAAISWGLFTKRVEVEESDLLEDVCTPPFQGPGPAPN
jgi:hypothetical protein